MDRKEQRTANYAYVSGKEWSQKCRYAVNVIYTWGFISASSFARSHLHRSLDLSVFLSLFFFCLFSVAHFFPFIRVFIVTEHSSSEMYLRKITGMYDLKRQPHVNEVNQHQMLTSSAVSVNTAHYFVGASFSFNLLARLVYIFFLRLHHMFEKAARNERMNGKRKRRKTSVCVCIATRYKTQKLVYFVLTKRHHSI